MSKFKFLLLVGFIGLIGFSAKAQVLGFVNGSDGCKSPSEVFIAQGKKLFFQIHVPLGGNFEVKLNPGTYELIAINEEGCEGKQSIELKKEQVNAQIKLVKRNDLKNRMPSMVSDVARSGGVALNGHFVGGLNSFSYPWWNPWAYYMFPMAQSNPCIWVIWGCNARLYPSGGPIAMGKPNIYIEGPDIENAKIELSQVEHHKLLATAPAHMEKGWTFSLKKNKMNIQGTEYPYLFYDSRAELKKNLNTRLGFCGSREEILDKMHTTLSKMSFPKRAIQDFVEYWVIKLPKLKNFCVYPQTNEQLAEAAPLEVSLPSYGMTRLLFFVVPKPGRRDLPKEKFLRELVQRKPAQWIEPNVKSNQAKWHIFEWGVAFPFEVEE